jgi:hypothetical protein
MACAGGVGPVVAVNTLDSFAVQSTHEQQVRLRIELGARELCHVAVGDVCQKECLDESVGQLEQLEELEQLW